MGGGNGRGGAFIFHLHSLACSINTRGGRGSRGSAINKALWHPSLAAHKGRGGDTHGNPVPANELEGMNLLTLSLSIMRGGAWQGENDKPREC